MLSKEDNKKALESRDIMTECDLLSLEKLSPHKIENSIENNERKEQASINRYGQD